MEVTTELLEELKNYLDISYTDANTDAKLTGIAKRGMKYLDHVAGETLEYIADDKPKELLFEYCRYVRSNALEVFQVNFESELLSLQMQKEVARYQTENADTVV